MLRNQTDIYSSVFDSRIMRQGKNKSQLRIVKHYEVELFREDGGTSHMGDNSFKVKRGMLLCAKPGDMRYSDFPVNCAFIRITPDKSEKECERILSSLPSAFYISDEKKTEELLALFGKLSNAMARFGDSAEDVDVLRINSLFFEILCRIVKLYKGNDEEKAGLTLSRAVREAYDYINENFCSDCSLKAISETIHVSPNYLHTIFCRQIGMTPYEYVNEKRIEKAKKLIMAGEHQMVEIALETGFCSQSHFNKVFKSRCGITPADYRKNFTYEY